jgi:signal transduction histidine kinase
MLQKLWSKSDGLGRNSLVMRFSAYNFSSVILFFLFLESNFTFDFWFYLTVSTNFLIPFLFFFWHLKSLNNKDIAFKQFVFDLILAGWIAGMTKLSVLPSFIFILSSYANYVATRGLHKLYRFLYPIFGIGLALLANGFSIEPYSSPYISYLSLGYGAFHIVSLAYISYYYALVLLNSNRKILEQKEEIDQQQEEILMQSEALKVSNESLLKLNKTLEEEVQKRTKELLEKNQRLAEYAFINAHKLRAPVASILGLVQFYQYHLSDIERKKINEKIELTANQLDKIVKEIRIKLEKENLIEGATINFLKEYEKKAENIQVLIQKHGP